MAAGPAGGQKWRALLSRAAFACLVADRRSTETPGRAQSVTPDLFNPRRTTQVAPDNLALRQISGSPSAAVLDPNARSIQTPPSTPTATRTSARPTSPRNRGSARSRSMACRPPAAPRDSGYDSLNSKRKPPKYYPAQARPKPPPGPGTPPPKPRPVNAVRPVAPVDPAVGERQQAAAAAGDGRHRAGPAAAPAAEDRRRSVRRGRRLRRQLPDQVGGRGLRWLRHQSRPHLPAARPAVLGRRARISRGLRLGAPRAGRGPARLLHRLWRLAAAALSTARSIRRRPMSTVPISPAMSTAGSMSPRISISPRRRGCGSRPTIPAARTSRRDWSAIRSMPRSAAPSVSTSASIGCRFPPARPSTAPSIRTRR